MLTMIAVYKLYWGRGIWNEISDKDEWSYDPETHKYKKREWATQPIRQDPLSPCVRLKDSTDQIDQTDLSLRDQMALSLVDHIDSEDKIDSKGGDVYKRQVFNCSLLRDDIIDF